MTIPPPINPKPDPDWYSVENQHIRNYYSIWTAFFATQVSSMRADLARIQSKYLSSTSLGDQTPKS